MAVKEEKVEETAKKAKVSTVKKKAEPLPEIADYERPELEKYDPNEFEYTKKDKPEKDLKVNTIYSCKQHCDIFFGLIIILSISPST